jgi:hypothetical protein
VGLISLLRSGSALPTKGVGTNQTVRGSDYGDQFVLDVLRPDHTQAYEGSLFIARPTPAAGGTGTALGIQTTFSDTANVPLLLKNGEAAGGKTYIPLYVRGRVTAAGQTTTSSEVSVEVDRINRYSSGGSSWTDGSGIYHGNPAATVAASLGTVYYGAVTAAAAGANRQFIGSALVKVQTAPCFTVNDVLLVTFGVPGSFTHVANVIGAGSTVETIHIPMVACAVPPGGSLLLHLANVANATTPPSVEWELAWVER